MTSTNDTQTCKFCNQPLHIHTSNNITVAECVNNNCDAYMITLNPAALAELTLEAVASYKMAETPHVRRGARPDNPFNGRTFG